METMMTTSGGLPWFQDPVLIMSCRPAFRMPFVWEQPCTSTEEEAAGAALKIHSRDHRVKPRFVVK
jgi:hypothetical protein